MFFKVTSVKTLYKIFLILLLSVFAVFLIICSFSKTAKGEKLPQNGADTQMRMKYIEDLGFATNAEFKEEEKIIEIPYTFSDVYEEYNALQKEAGYDLEKFVGKKVKQYTYKLLDKERNDLYAHLLVYEGSIIGGDISAIDFKNGYMLPLKKICE